MDLLRKRVEFDECKITKENHERLCSDVLTKKKICII